MSSPFYQRKRGPLSDNAICQPFPRFVQVSFASLLLGCWLLRKAIVSLFFSLHFGDARDAAATTQVGAASCSWYVLEPIE